MENTESKEYEIKTWITILFCVLIVLLQGMFAFVVVGDKGQPTWQYWPVKDVPGESPYAIYPLLPYPQHVRGDKGE
jgi:hypothetical protein